MSDFKRAKTLVKSIRYPTFQFWAKANNKKTADRQMVIAILTSLEWLRTKFNEFNIPEEIKVPKWEQYKNISTGDLKSVHINEGYTVDIINLPQQKIWALRLIEPDLSTRFENNVEISCAVPGCIFQTGIAFSIADDVFQCGVKITVSEPDVQTEPCKAYRPSLIQVLTENPLLDLRCGYPIIREDAWRLDKTERIKQLREYLSSGNIPAVILCDYESDAKQTVPSFEGMINEIKNTSPFLRSSSSVLSPNMDTLLLKVQSMPKEQETRIAQYDVSGLLKYRTCHAHYFRCGKGMLTELNKLLKINAKSGDIVLIETALCGGDAKYFPKTDDPAENVSKVLYYLLEYPNGKPYNYGSVFFYADALLKQMDALRNEQSIDLRKIKILNEEIDILSAHTGMPQKVLNLSGTSFIYERRQVRRDHRDNERRQSCCARVSARGKYVKVVTTAPPYDEEGEQIDKTTTMSETRSEEMGLIGEWLLSGIRSGKGSYTDTVTIELADGSLAPVNAEFTMNRRVSRYDTDPLGSTQTIQKKTEITKGLKETQGSIDDKAQKWRRRNAGLRAHRGAGFRILLDRRSHALREQRLSLLHGGETMKRLRVNAAQ